MDLLFSWCSLQRQNLCWWCQISAIPLEIFVVSISFKKWKWASTWWDTPFLDETHTMVSDTSSLVQSHTYKKRDPVDVPYQTGQLHPAIRVADLLQHITQMKCAEGYGFKEEYEVGVRPKDLIFMFSAPLVVCVWCWVFTSVHMAHILQEMGFFWTSRFVMPASCYKNCLYIQLFKLVFVVLDLQNPCFRPLPKSLMTFFTLEHRK